MIVSENVGRVQDLLRQRTQELTRMFNSKVEERLKQLLDAGYEKREIGLSHIGSRTKIYAGGRLDSEFWIEHKGNEIIVRGRGRWNADD